MACPAAARFIKEHIASVPSLEALLLMRRTPEKKWTAAMMAAALYLDIRQTAALLADLAQRGLCSTQPDSETAYFWPPAILEIAAGVDGVAEHYERHLVAVTNLIHSKPRPSVRGFSDAFRLRGPE